MPKSSVIWGIDPDTKRIAIAISALDGVHVAFRSIEIPPVDPLPNGEARPTWARLATVHQAVTTQAKWILDELGFPICIAIEKPIARGTSYALIHNYGVVLAGLYEVVSHRGDPLLIEVGQSSWKKEMLGDGKATPDDYCRILRQRSVQFDNPDEAAAFWINQYAAERIERPGP